NVAGHNRGKAANQLRATGKLDRGVTARGADDPSRAFVGGLNQDFELAAAKRFEISPSQVSFQQGQPSPAIGLHLRRDLIGHFGGRRAAASAERKNVDL